MTNVENEDQDDDIQPNDIVDFGFRPLYKQIYDLLVGRIAKGVWRPSEALPSEQALATELGVSQGTVRKALGVLAAEQLVERRQGKGTYVARHTQESTLFRFFRIARPGAGERVTPTSDVLSIKRRLSSAKEWKQLALQDGSEVMEALRIRLIDGFPAILERVIVPLSLFPDIDKLPLFPNTLYSLYQSSYSVSVVSVREELKADMANKEDSKYLKLAVGAPLLHIERVAFSLDGQPVEWRISRCDTRHLVYTITLR